MNEGIECGRYAPRIVGDSGQAQTHFDAADRRCQHQVVKAAQVADAKDFSLEFAQAGTQR